MLYIASATLIQRCLKQAYTDDDSRPWTISTSMSTTNRNLRINRPPHGRIRTIEHGKYSKTNRGYRRESKIPSVEARAVKN